MRLYEYEAKKILCQYGIATPVGALARTGAEARDAAVNIGKEVVVKAQMLTGGRGKIGAVMTAHTPEDAERMAKKLIGQEIRGYRVNSLLVEERLDLTKEIYLGITVDDKNGIPVAIVSAEGGVEIEEIAQRDPTKIAYMPIDPLFGIRNYDAINLLRKIGFCGQPLVAASKVVIQLYRIFCDIDARLTEINPLVITEDDRIVAADAKCDIDNHSLFRHPQWQKTQLQRIDNVWEREAAEYGVNYLDLDGSIAVMANGAGLTMALMDMMRLQGANPACFLDTGGGLSQERMKNALGLLLKKAKLDARMKVLFIMIRMMISPPDAVAKGILEAIHSTRVTTPIITVIRGREPYQKQARALLLSNPQIKLHSSLEEGLAQAIDIATKG